MRENNLFTYILYAALIGLVSLAGYKYWQNIQEKKAKSEELAANEQQKFSELGYEPMDTSGTAYVGTGATAGGDVAYIPPGGTVNSNGIEEEPTATNAAKGGNTTTAESKSTKPKTVAKSVNTVRHADEAATTDGRYRVVAGSFTKMDGARREMERLVKMGYQDAEVGLYNSGKFAVVIVKRTDDLNEANRIVDRLEAKRIDAAVVDSYRKN